MGHQLKVKKLLEILTEQEIALDEGFVLETNPQLLDEKAKALLNEAYFLLGGEGECIALDRLKFDFKINRFLFIYDDAVHFNRYRLSSFKSDVYNIFTFAWVESYKRLCRTFEKDCLKAGTQERIWNGPPIAEQSFGQAEEPGDLSGNGASGWRLNAYNDVQYDLLTRLHGYKIIRIPMYENIMLGGSLKKIDQLLAQPKTAFHKPISSWILRKMV